MVAELVDNFGVNRLFSFPAWSIKSRLLGETKRLGGSRISSFFERIVGSIPSKENNARKIPPIANVYKSMGESLRVSAIPRSNVISVVFDWPDPVIAARVVNSLVELYLAKHVKVHTDPQTYNLLKEQAKKWEKKLRESERDLEAFKRRHFITSLPQQKKIFLEKLSEAESREHKTESEAQETFELISALEFQLIDLDQKTQLQETVNKDEDTLTALKEKLVELELQGLKEEINRVKRMIAEEEKKEQVMVVSGKSPLRQSLEIDLYKAKARLEALKAKKTTQVLQTANYREGLKNLDRYQKQMSRLERQITINEVNYKLYLTKFEEAKISESMDKQRIANVSVIEPAIPPLKPVKPRKRLIVMMGGLLGLIAGIGTALLIEFIHPVFRTREDVDEFLGLPVLAILPKEK
jgi:uncharacterized protein involved in exopolysaccharide biosynthesis